MILWCLKENDEAGRFYEKAGGKEYQTGFLNRGGKDCEMISYLYDLEYLDRIGRVEKYERLFDEATACPDEEKLRLLDAYYTSGEWREDYEADERGEFPPDLKRGVLSQDALYDLLEGVGHCHDQH